MTLLSAIILLGILIFVHELGHFLFAKLMGVKVLKFSLGFGPKIVGKKYGETEYLLSSVPLGGYVKMLGEEQEDEISEEDRARAFNFQSVWKRLLIVFSGPVFNIALTFIIFASVLSMGFPVNVPVLGNILPVIDEVQEGYPAVEAGLKAGDVIKKIDNVEVDTWFDMVAMVAKNPGKALNFVVKRGDEVLSVRVVPRPVEEVGSDGKKITIGRIGVRKKGGGFFETIQSRSPLETLGKSAIATYKMGVVVFDSIRMLVMGKLSPKNIGGPITIVSESGKAASGGFLSYIMFMAFISVNLGVLNLLPIPILDGGHLLFFGIEAVRRKPLSDKVTMIAQRIGLAILIAVMVLAFYNDIMRLIARRMVP
ncbi:MAG TPA: RIP metalloprotease RseP [Thermodesulfovibrionales bacterium]|nr:RIP metalloprotease RseP [Thermodesulfovibrionales bacterium]